MRPESLERAFALGLEAVAADGLAVRRGGDLAWLPGVRNAEPDSHGSRSLGALIPAVACFHDRDLAQAGVDWLDRLLARWRSAGADRFIDLRELTSALGLRLALDPPGRLAARGRPGTRPGAAATLPGLVRAPDRLPAALAVVTPQGPLRLDVEPVAGSVSRVLLRRDLAQPARRRIPTRTQV